MRVRILSSALDDLAALAVSFYDQQAGRALEITFSILLFLRY